MDRKSKSNIDKKVYDKYDESNNNTSFIRSNTNNDIIYEGNNDFWKS